MLAGAGASLSDALAFWMCADRLSNLSDRLCPEAHTMTKRIVAKAMLQKMRTGADDCVVVRTAEASWREAVSREEIS